MQYRNNKARVCAGVTLVEMIIAVAIMVIVFTAITPLFRGILNSWDSKAGAAETVQNGRVLIDHLNRNISKAVRITDVSDSAVTTGYIEFEDNDGNTLRYDIASSYVEFGVVGDLSDLAGPVSTLQFTCYDACDLDTPITEVNDIRCVEVQTTLTNPAPLGEDRTFTTTVYLRVNDSNGTGGGDVVCDLEDLSKGTPFEFEALIAATPALAQIDSTHYLLSYAGGADKDQGWASVLTVNTGTWEITEGTPLLVDADKLKTPALIQVNSTHYLCAYSGDGDLGTAVILTVDTGEITKGTPLVFDDAKGKTPALAQIDSTHYLCAYAGDGDDGTAVVLTVDTGTWEITAGTAMEFDGVKGKTPALAQIDATHFLCAYGGDGDIGTAVVLTVDTDAGTVTKETLSPFVFSIVKAKTPKLAQINSTHYLCVYDENGLGHAVVLIVNTGTWVITEGTHLIYDSVEGKTPALAQIDSTNYLCAYDGGTGADGCAVVLTVDTDTWNVTKGTVFVFDSTLGETPWLAQIDDCDYLCAYEGEGSGGYAVVLKFASSGGGGGGEILP